MWFADREPMPGEVREMRPPVPTRKVDPKYVASAAAERVEGKVQLSAVIRRDGHVESVTVLKHLDDRLDFSATEALQKWEFEPARRDGRPVDVDAIFEIPFRLEPVAIEMTRQHLIVDADDTLWENNIYFETGVRRLFRIPGPFAPDGGRSAGDAGRDRDGERTGARVRVAELRPKPAPVLRAAGGAAMSRRKTCERSWSASPSGFWSSPWR